MKTKIVILGVCALLSACGGSKRGEGNVHGSINLSNLKVHSYSKAILNVAGEEYYSLGSFDVSELPDEIKKLPPGSEIGTLAVEYQDELYALEYTGEIKPTVSNRTEETMATVYILKESGSTQMLTLAVKKDEKLKLSEISETVSVKHSPKPYCAKARFFLHQVADKVAVLDQLAGCYPNHLCDVNLTVEIPAFRDKKNYFKFSLLSHQPYNLANRCEQEDTSWTQDTRINRWVPKASVVSLFSVYSRVYRQLRFTL